MSDERAQLRADLEAGQWQRLTDPLLPLVLLEDSGKWWRCASVACAHALALELQIKPGQSLAGWTVDLLASLECCRWRWKRNDPRQLATVLAVARQAPDHAVPDAIRAAIDILERWPAPRGRRGRG